MSQSRKFRRQYRAAARERPLPPGWDKVEARERERVNVAMKTVAAMLPDRGLILLAIPGGSSTQDVDAMACVHNLTDRTQVAGVFEAMLEWWSGQVILAQPDRALVTALREGVDSIRDIPLAELAAKISESAERLAAAVNAVRPGTAGDITQDALLITTSALAIFNKFHGPQQHEAPGGSADGSGAPSPEPMPPPREWPKGTTKETLVADLLARPPSEHRDQIIAMAQEGKFHAYESEVATPKILLVDLLARFGYPDLAGKARDGGYDDEHATVVQSEELRADVGAAVFDALTGADASKRGKA